ncbi:hypothetical protein HMPREF1148_0536 [Selenomonas sp. FOBRC6]|uniref:hypothetical protein n=1 Tax=Selenomonas sp. FOBRC6 TaxID=936572 RepID=UPI0002781A0D|nr:hypothetical protein [Selenomonas sp. FOBRC6]EJO21394.1 hypothetical protein HMPREF1148_0536 [Selenomonas sp. FOBRC6]
MKMSSKRTMLTAAVLLTLSSGTAYAATPGTVDSQELFHANRLVTDPAQNPAVEETAAPDRYEASISAQKKESVTAATAPPVAKAASQPARLRWDSVDARLAARNGDPSFSLSAQKAKPVIITAEDIKREEKLAAKEGRPVQELVGDVNMNRPTPPPKPKRLLVPSSERPVMNPHAADASVPPQTNVPPASGQHAMRQDSAAVQPIAPPPVMERQAEKTGQNASVLPTSPPVSAPEAEQRPERQRYPQLPHREFSLTPPAENGAAAKQPERFEALDSTNAQRPAVAPVKDHTPAVEHSVRPDGIPELAPRQIPQNSEADLAGISDEVRRHILAGQLAMEVQLQRDPSVAGMRAITKVLRENTTLTRLQKIDFLIGFGRALHQSGLPRQQEALLIKTIADAF